jgi:putative holliday junction resolvase
VVSVAERRQTVRRAGRAVRRGARLAVDVGSVRIGVAKSDPDGVLASPLTIVHRGAGDLAAIARLSAEHEAIEVVVGLPLHLSGQHGSSAADARAFAAQLATLVAPTPVRLVDERFTTVLADAALRRAGRAGRKRRAVVDQAAAALLLQGALDQERLTGSPVGEVLGSADGGLASDSAAARGTGQGGTR